MACVCVRIGGGLGGADSLFFELTNKHIQNSKMEANNLKKPQEH